MSSLPSSLTQELATSVTCYDYVLITFGPNSNVKPIVIKAHDGASTITVEQFKNTLANSLVPIRSLKHDSFMYSPKHKNEKIRKLTGLILLANSS